MPASLLSLLGVGGAATGAAFSPTDLSGLQLWLRADQGTYQDDALTTPATANNDPIGGWDDQAGTNNATQATAGSRPLLKTSGGPNSQHYIDPDNSDDRLALASTITLATTFTYFIVLRYPTLDGIYFMGSSGNNRHRVLTTGAVQAVMTTNTAITNTGVVAANTWTMLRIRRDGSGNLTGYVNGANQTSGTPNNANSTSIAFVFAHTSATTSNVDIAELLIYNTHLSDAECTQIESFLNTRYALF